MRPIDVLKTEHRVIEQVLACLDRMATRCLAEKVLDAASARQAIDFFQNFADRCHHGKEEQRLFPLLEARGIPRPQGPIGVMLDEHEQGRRHLHAMAEEVGKYEAGALDAAVRFARHAEDYVDLLRQHIQKEDHCLFAMAEQVLTEADQRTLVQSFDHVEDKEMGPGTHGKYLRIADELAERWGVPKAQVAAAGHGCHSCGTHSGH